MTSEIIPEHASATDGGIFLKIKTIEHYSLWPRNKYMRDHTFKCYSLIFFWTLKVGCMLSVFAVTFLIIISVVSI